MRAPPGGRTGWVTGAGLLLALMSASVLSAQDPAPVVVASKTFAESHILGEIFSQALEAAGIRVDRRPGLGSTEIMTQARSLCPS